MPHVWAHILHVRPERDLEVVWAAAAVADTQRLLPGVWFPGDDMVDRLVNLPASDYERYVLHNGTCLPNQFRSRPLVWEKNGLFHPLHVVRGRILLCCGSDRPWGKGGLWGEARRGPALLHHLRGWLLVLLVSPDASGDGGCGVGNGGRGGG